MKKTRENFDAEPKNRRRMAKWGEMMLIVVMSNYWLVSVAAALTAARKLKPRRRRQWRLLTPAATFFLLIYSTLLNHSVEQNSAEAALRRWYLRLLLEQVALESRSLALGTSRGTTEMMLEWSRWTHFKEFSTLIYWVHEAKYAQHTKQKQIRYHRNPAY